MNAKTTEPPLEVIYPIEVADISVSDDNVRLTAPEKNLDELIASIKIHGLLQPVVLVGTPGKPPYKLISGQRRFLAHEAMGAKYIRAVFVGKLDKTELIIRSLVENLQRRQLEYSDTAKAITDLYEEFGKDERKVAAHTGLSLGRVRNFIEIEAKATPKMKALLKTRKISVIDLKRAIRAAQDNMKKADALVDLIIAQQPNAHQKRRLLMYGTLDKNASAESILEDAMKPHVEESMVITLPEDVRKALAKATTKLKMDPEELATKVIGDWLREQGFGV